MGSISKEVRQTQSDRAKRKVKLREESLKEKGITGKIMEKDPILKKLKAAARKAKNQIIAIDKIKEHVENVKKGETDKKKAPAKKKKKKKK